MREREKKRNERTKERKKERKKERDRLKHEKLVIRKKRPEDRKPMYGYNAFTFPMAK